ncbi:NAD binding oxidoreductase [Xylariaceae sp. FL0662B]|nr:NAD binding oxidoreductase [Xylariaceae sp. FL0662B]
MALVLQACTFLWQYGVSWIQCTPKKKEDALKCGVISTANINPASLIHPAETHPDVVLYAIASRDKASAERAAKAYGFQKAYGSYDALLQDPAVDFVYISTPNGLHFEWAFKALRAGKHVLLEKPFTSNADEAIGLVKEAERTEKVLMEAFHWQFHPAAHLWRSIIDSGKYGRIIRTEAHMTCSPEVPEGDIRWQYDLAGGSFMDCTYALSFTRYALHAGRPMKILSAVARPREKDRRVDEAMNVTMLLRDQRGDLVHSRVYTDLARGYLGGLVPRFWELPSIEVETDKAVIYFYNAMMPHLYHYISVADKATGAVTTHKQYAGGPLWGDVVTSNGVKGGSATWSTYRWQLEAFVDKIRGRDPVAWVTNEDSIAQMEVIDACYEQAGLGKRSTNQSPK